MPRGRPKKQPSIADLQSMLRDQRNRRTKLVTERKKLAAKLDQVDRQIAALDGQNGGNINISAGGRARNEQSLPDAIHDTMKKNGKPMKVGDIVDGVLKSGYHSTSANFRGIVNQALIKDDRFTQHSRGIYKLK
jgi:hypothetical protein